MRAEVTNVLLLLHPPIAIVHVLMLLRRVFGMSVELLLIPGLDLETLGRRWHNAVVLLGEEGDLLLFHLPLLLLQLLLLQELNLGIDVGDSVVGSMLWGH